MIGSATHGTGPGDSSPGSAAFAFAELGRALAGVAAGLLEALAPVVEAIAAQFALLRDELVRTFGDLATFARLCWDEGACLHYAVRVMGVAESDVRAVLLHGHRRCPAPHVWLWNHRRIPFPAGSPPALVWGSP